MSDYGTGLHLFFLEFAKKIPKAEWVSYPLWGPWYALQQPWWSSAWGQDFSANLFTPTAELTLWPHVQFIKFAFSTGLGFQSILAWALWAFKNFSREMLSTDLLSYIHPSHGCEVWHEHSIIALGLDLEFHFINILFCKDLERGGDLDWHCFLRDSSLLPVDTYLRLASFCPFLTPLAVLTHVFCILRAGFCAVHGNRVWLCL